MKMKSAIAILLTLTMLLAGCFGGAEEIAMVEEEVPIWDDYQMIDKIPAISPWEFTTIDLSLNQSTTTSWAVFDKITGATVVNTISPRPSKAISSTLEANIRYGLKIEGTNGTLLFQGF